MPEATNPQSDPQCQVATLLSFYSIWFKYYLLFSNGLIHFAKKMKPLYCFLQCLQTFIQLHNNSSFSLIRMPGTSPLTCLWTSSFPNFLGTSLLHAFSPFGSNLFHQHLTMVKCLSSLKNKLNLYQSFLSHRWDLLEILSLFTYHLHRPKFTSVCLLLPLLH